MKGMLSFSIFLLMLSVATLGFCNEDDSSLKIMISKVPAKNTIEVKIKNISNDYVVLYNKWIFFENIDTLQLPFSELRFYIDKGKGFERLILKTEKNYPVFNFADPRQFLFLNPGDFWGLELDLESEFKINLSKGNYIIKAVYENRSRSWMNKWVDEYFSKEQISQMHFKRQNVFDGVIESNSLNVEIGE
jgi:hypothetical protein